MFETVKKKKNYNFIPALHSINTESNLDLKKK